MSTTSPRRAPASGAPRDFLAALHAQEASLRNLAHSLCRSHDRAERLLTHVMAKAKTDHASFDRKSNFAGWLMKMMRREFNATLTAGGLVEEVTSPTVPMKKTPAEKVAGTSVPIKPAASNLRTIDTAPFMSALKTLKTAPSTDFGPTPELAWIEIRLLRIDPGYQREILRRGRSNVLRIAAQFDWRMFVPVIVARVSDGLYAIVDGQHRTTAAACRGILKVPCQIIDAAPAAQAAAFAAINGNVTQMSSLQLHAARVAAGDREAAALDEVCARGGTQILKYPVPSNLIRAGQTLAVSCLGNALKTYGADVVTTSLLCISGTGDGNPGLLRAPLIRGLCQVMSQRPQLARDPERAMKIAEAIDFAMLLEEAGVEAKRARVPVTNIVAIRLGKTFGPEEEAEAA